MNKSFLIALSLIATSLAVAQQAGDRRALADSLLARGFHRLAIPEYQQIAKSNPPPADLDVVVYRLAECQRCVGDEKAALATLAKFEERFPQSGVRFHAVFMRGTMLASSGRHADAIRDFDTVMVGKFEGDDLKLTATLHAGEEYLANGVTNFAKARFNTLVVLADGVKTPASKELIAHAKISLAKIKEVELGPEEAIADFRKLAETPVSPRIGAEALYQISRISYGCGKYDDSLVAYRALVQKYKDDPRANEAGMTAAWAAYRAGRATDALQIAQSLASVATGESAAGLAFIAASSQAAMNKHVEAAAAFDYIITNFPHSSYAQEARFSRLNSLLKSKQYGELLSMAAAMPSDAVQASRAADMLWLQAEAADGLADQERAFQFRKMLVERHPQSQFAPDALFRLAKNRQDAKEWKDAVKYYGAVSSSYPSNSLAPRALFLSGYCQSMAGNGAGARRDWEKLIAEYPAAESLSEAVYRKALVELAAGDLEAAGQTLDMFMSMTRPANAEAAETQKRRMPDAKFWRARVYYDSGDDKSAERLLRECLAMKPSEDTAREANFLLGRVLQRQKRLDEAAKCFQPLLSAKSRDKFTPELLAWLAEYQLTRGENQSVLDAAVELETRDGTTPQWQQAAASLSARAYLAMGKTNNAVASFKKAADMPQRTRYGVESALTLAKVNQAIGDSEGAMEYFSKAAEKAVTDDMLRIRAEAYFGMGDVSESTGNDQAAVKYFTTVALLFDDPELTPKSASRAAAILERTGHADEAAKMRSEFGAK